MPIASKSLDFETWERVHLGEASQEPFQQIRLAQGIQLGECLMYQSHEVGLDTYRQYPVFALDCCRSRSRDHKYSTIARRGDVVKAI